MTVGLKSVNDPQKGLETKTVRLTSDVTVTFDFDLAFRLFVFNPSRSENAISGILRSKLISVLFLNKLIP
jgi:hypothetical protein